MSGEPGVLSLPEGEHDSLAGYTTHGHGEMVFAKMTAIHAKDGGREMKKILLPRFCTQSRLVRVESL